MGRIELIQAAAQSAEEASEDEAPAEDEALAE